MNTKSVSTRSALGALGLLFALATQTSWALAGTSGGIAGTITDANTGAPIAGVHLKISSPSQSVDVVTDAHGHYIAFSLQPDDYTLTATKDGYAARSLDGYSVFADQTQRYDLQLYPAASGAPPGQ